MTSAMEVPMPAVAADPPLLASAEVLTRVRAVVDAAYEHHHIDDGDRLRQLALLRDGATLATARQVASDVVLCSPDLHTVCAELALELIGSTPPTRSGSLASAPDGEL
jgi:hypothetical protein